MENLLKNFSLQKFLFVLLIITLLVFFHTRGFPYQDEGWFLQAGLRMYNGEVPYKDFQFVYTPGGIYANFLAFKVFGVSVLASRLAALVNSLITISLLYLISKKLKLASFLTAVMISFYVFWGPAHINFVWPVMLCLTTAILSVTLFLYADKSRYENFLFFLTGSVSALAFIFKQNFGLAILLANLLYFFITKLYKKPKLVILHFLGFIFILFVQTLIFINTDSLGWFVKDFNNLTYLKIFKEGVYNSLFPWQYPAPILIKILKTLIYALPLITSLYAFRKIYSLKDKSLISIPIISIFFYIFSIRPTTDYVHLVPLIALSVLPLFLIYRFVTKALQKKIYTTSVFVLIVLGAYSALFRNYYRWNPPLIKQSFFTSHPRLGIFVDQKNFNITNEFQKFFEETLKEEKYIFVYDYEPLIYFLFDKKNPTSFDYLHIGILTDEVNSDVINALSKRNVSNIITNIDVTDFQTPIAEFIRYNYKPVESIERFTIWEKKSMHLEN